MGASAGGLSALSELFRHVPAKTGLAYVIVQHLSPTHESTLAELLGRNATIPVHQAANGMRVDVDCAYVIAPDTEMTLTDGHLKLVPRDPDARPPLPIDALFRSLADVQKSRTIGVILSGTGSDGALGVRSIKGAGGITFVQDPASASSRGMPLAAIATDCVDVVASPAEIAEQLSHLGQHPYLHITGGGQTVSSDDSESDVVEELASASSSESVYDGEVSAISGLLRRRFGVDFTLYKIGTVERRIRRRMALRRVDGLAAYANLLRRDVGELGALYNDLLIGVTRFFRDPDVFEALSKILFPQLVKRRSPGHSTDHEHDRYHGSDHDNDAPVRIWVAGCSTGEEAYSIAICVLEFLETNAPGTPVQIFATDLSESAIAIARAGAYPQGIEADVTPERLRRFFTQEEAGYRVTRMVRDCCVFARQNITADPPFSQIDLISCRNVLIYLQARAHAKVLAVFHYALKPSGILVLGTSESTSTVPALFTQVSKKHRIYTRAPGSARPLYLDYMPDHPISAPVLSHVAQLSHGRSTASGDRDGAQNVANSPARGLAHPAGPFDTPVLNLLRSPTVPDVQRTADQVVIGCYAPAGVVVDDQLLIVQFRGNTGSYIEPSAGSASLHLLKLVKPELATELRQAIDAARAEARPKRIERVSFHDGPRLAFVTLAVTPFRVTGSDGQFFMVSFEEATSGAESVRQRGAGDVLDATHNHKPQKGGESLGKRAANTKVAGRPAKRGSAAWIKDLEARFREALKRNGEFAQDLEATRRHLQAVTEEHSSVVEEFQAANEEVQSSNEELQSTNEEIETSKEELQSLNEELTTVNDELRIRNSEASHLNDDLTNLLTSMHVPVIMVGTDLRIRRFTAGAERMVNLIATDVGRPIGDIKSNIDVPNLDELITRVIATLEVTEREVRDLDGCWYLMHIRPYRTADRKIDGAVIIFYDIDARKRAIEQSEASRRYAEAIVETVREPLLVLDERLRVLSANHAFYDGFATSPADTTDRALFELGNGQWDIPTLRGLLEGVLTDGEPFNEIEVEHDFPGKGRRTMLLNARRVPSARNGLPLVLLAIEDVTAQKLATGLLARANTDLAARASELEATTFELLGKTAEAQASNRAKSDFLATMSHELRTPLNAIAGYAQLLEMGIRGPVTDEQRTDLARITRSQKHLLGLINEILNYAKVEAGVVPMRFADVNVSDLLASVEVMIAPQMARKELRYELLNPNGHGDPTLAVRGDEDKIRQILLNLLTNALKFTAAEGTVDVSCDTDHSGSNGSRGNGSRSKGSRGNGSHADGEVSIHVRDTGIGISPEHLHLIFDPFVQVNASLTRPSDGVGLGLAISRELARAMEGDITVESTLGTGSTFTLTLPRARLPINGT
ncbi:MAG: chemotaxis protein CheB [Gemmatimonadaceae bacterium]